MFGRRVDLELFCHSCPIKVALRVWLHNEMKEDNISVKNYFKKYLKKNDPLLLSSEQYNLQNEAYYVTRVQSSPIGYDDSCLDKIIEILEDNDPNNEEMAFNHLVGGKEPATSSR